MTDEERFRQAAERLIAEHDGRAQQQNLPGDLAPRSIAEAYAIQDRLQALYLARGRRIAGWKVALTTPVMQKMVGVPHPCEGAIFDDRVHRGTARLAAAGFRHIGVESEIAVEIGHDLDGLAGPYTRETVADAVAAVMAGIELVDDRDCVYGTLHGVNLIADNSFNFGCVVGEPKRDWHGLDLAAARGRMVINGETVGEGRGGDVMGHPFEALAWLANSLVARGKPLQAGQLVLTGSVVATKWLKPGDEMATVIDGIGEARLVVS